ncbi:MAG: fumarate hydratase C-terminal domain-containing protein [Anaerolineales bacterium]|nr:fumarate hydratase C-terminal domain-containing protein [Anaerolineales bacterium]
MLALTTPLTDDVARGLRVGQRVTLTGTLYTARDAAHERLAHALAAGQTLPIPLAGQIIYYVGPAPAKPGAIIGPAGPTTAGRVDLYTPALLAQGLKGMVGKGKRSPAVRAAIVAHGAVYFVMVGGAAALISEHIRSVTTVAYADLGTEAIARYEVEGLPMVVANDAIGGDLYEQGQAAYQRPLPGAEAR